MKKLVIPAALLVSALPATAASVVFGDGDNVGDTSPWNSLIGTTASETATITQDGIQFDLAITAVAVADGGTLALSSNSDFLGVDGDVRLDAGATTNDTMRLQLTVSGANIASLVDISLAGIVTSFGANVEDLGDFTDGSVTASAIRVNSGLDYDDRLSTLTALSKSNVGGEGDNSWLLEFESVGSSNWSIDTVTFNYTVPEPSSYALIIGLSVLSLTLVRRRIN